MILDIHQLSFSYGNETKVLKNLNFSFGQRELVAVLGTSGCGKTTLLKCISGLESPQNGEILYKGKNIVTLSQREKDDIRKKEIGIIMQDYALISCLNVVDNLALALEINHEIRFEAIKQAEKVLNEFQLDHRRNCFPRQLSGGEKQRVAIARAMIKNPQFLLADEPTGNLDRKNTKMIMETFLDLKQKMGILMVTHDLYAASFCDRIVRMERGSMQKSIEKRGKNRDEFLNLILKLYEEEERLQ